MESPFSISLTTMRMKVLSKLDGIMLYRKLGVGFSSTDELLYPNTKVRLWLIRARHKFMWLETIPLLVLELLTARLTFVVFSLKDDYPEKKNGHGGIYSSGVQLFKDSSQYFRYFRYTKPVHSRKRFYQFSVGLLFEWIHFLHSLDRMMKIRARISSSIID